MEWKILLWIVFFTGLSSSKPRQNTIDPQLLLEIFGTPPPSVAKSTTTTSRPFTKFDTSGLEALIDEVFGTTTEEIKHDEKSPNIPGKINDSENEDCECVSYYLCSNGTIIEDGVGLIDIRLGGTTCENYLDVCCKHSDILERDKRRLPVASKREGCGHRHFNGVGFRITGHSDNEAQFGEFPWMVAVLRTEGNSSNQQGEKINHFQCGGSLIHPQAVLTAAHCVKGRDFWELIVRAGEWDTQTRSEPLPHQNRDVSRIIIHPNFKSGNLHNDFAILILSKPVEYAENVDIVCLPDKYDVFDNARCAASGWGKDVFGKEGHYQVILKRVEVPVVNHGACQNSLRSTRLGKYFRLDNSFICAGGELGKDTCKGDGGSPLVCPLRNDPTRYSQAGIVSWGIGCGEDGVPGVYANVAHAREWIDQQLAQVFTKL
ncbi:phenoloxidase-activating factor 2-like [Microplitis mediator]|uniref:phenoloxidase-activating factor 2-like n=1 Tax=Microplitis mediator TaxID=375433 RepID=UPI0025568FC8|nr:phenoloxidase-activating factor 2-like [Microplitis mediator]XP_057334404.1 phenoloxidase-activating factor 2-like [Microplitis mediator]